MINLKDAVGTPECVVAVFVAILRQELVQWD